MNTTLAPLGKAKGSVLVLTALSLLVILGMAGLAIDLGHSFSNKTRLQNSVDAAALAAAMKLLEELQNHINTGNTTPLSTGDSGGANDAGTATHQANLASFGTNWLTSPSPIEFCWTRNLQDFGNCQSLLTFNPTNNPSDPNITTFFVRARVASTALQNFFMQVMGMGPTRSVGAVAVAGTSGNIYDCNIAPFFVCDNSGTTPADSDCSDGNCFGNPVTRETDPAVDPTHFFGLKVGSDNPPATPVSSCPATTPFQTNGCVVIRDLRAGTTDDPATPLDEAVEGFPVVINKENQTDWEFNPSITLNGNFGYLQLVDVNGENTNSGAPGMKYNVLQPNSCTKLGTVSTQTGNISSLDAAFNALFGDPKPPYDTNGNPMPQTIDHYADFVANGPFYSNIYYPVSFNFYRLKYAANPSWTNNSSHYHQRLRNIPVIDCPDPLSGNQTDLPVKGYACFFFNRKMYDNSDTGNLPPNEDWVIAEHIDNKFCPPVLGVGQGTPKSILKANIVLYQYYDSADS